MTTELSELDKFYKKNKKKDLTAKVAKVYARVAKIFLKCVNTM